MKDITNSFLLIALLITCVKLQSQTNENEINTHKELSHIKEFQYKNLTIPLFFNKLVSNHLMDFHAIDSMQFIQFCLENNVQVDDSSNIRKYFTINFLHKIFTSKTASNCSKGEIINIPYQWHWVESNPRYEIYFTNNNTLLKNTNPPREFSRYNSYADIDRTPYLFLKDMVSEDLKYYSSSCDTFSTFGWCSEREMAFVALSKLLELDGKVVSEGNHSWTELLIPILLNNCKTQNFIVRVDNTFDELDWKLFKDRDLMNWRIYLGNTAQAAWYNQKANSRMELDRIKNHQVSIKSMSRIESKVVEYLNYNIN